MLKRVSSAIAKFVSPVTSTRPLKVEPTDAVETEFKKFDQNSIPHIKGQSKDEDSSSKDKGSKKDRDRPGLKTQSEEDQESSDPHSKELHSPEMDQMVTQMRAQPITMQSEEEENPSIAKAFIQLLGQLQTHSHKVSSFLGKKSYRKSHSNSHSKNKFPKGTIYDRNVE